MFASIVSSLAFIYNRQKACVALHHGWHCNAFGPLEAVINSACVCLLVSTLYRALFTTQVFGAGTGQTMDGFCLEAQSALNQAACFNVRNPRSVEWTDGDWGGLGFSSNCSDGLDEEPLMSQSKEHAIAVPMLRLYFCASFSFNSSC